MAVDVADTRAATGVAPIAHGLERDARRADSDFWWTRASIAVDASMLLAAVLVTEAGATWAGVPSTPRAWLVVFPLLTLTLLAARGMYRPRLFPRMLDDLRATVTTTALAAMITLSLRVLFTDYPWTAAQTARLWAFAAFYVVAGRAVVYWWQLQARKDGDGLRPTLVIGAGNVGRVTAKRLVEHPELGLKPIGFLDKEPLNDEREGGVPVLGASWDLERVVSDHGVRHVVIAFSTAPHDVLFRILNRCRLLGVDVSFVPRLYEKMTGHISVEYLGGLPLITAEPTDPRGSQFAVKHALDRVGAAVLLVLAAPVLAAAALAVLLSLGRPILLRQERVGRDEKVFDMLKFRTMRPPRGVEAGNDRPDLLPDTAPGGVEGEDRRTPTGAFLRRTSLDELPQLVNVLRGEMSLVGPRPERPEYVDLFQQNVYRYGERHRVKAGMTGWAQVHGLRGKSSLSDRVEWDNHYIENWCLWLDVKILVMTLAVVLGRRYAD